MHIDGDFAYRFSYNAATSLVTRSFIGGVVMRMEETIGQRLVQRSRREIRRLSPRSRVSRRLERPSLSACWQSLPSISTLTLEYHSGLRLRTYAASASDATPPQICLSKVQDGTAGTERMLTKAIRIRHCFLPFLIATTM